MKICISSPYFPPDMGAGSTQAWNSCIGLKKRGHDVVVVTTVPHYPDGKIPHEFLFKPFSITHNFGITVIRTWVPPIPSKGIAQRMLIWFLYAFLYNFALLIVKDIDIFLGVGGMAPSPFNIPAFINSKLRRVPLVMPEDDSIPTTIQAYWRLPGIVVRMLTVISKALERSADHIVTYSNGIKNIIISRGIDPSKITIRPLPIDTEKFQQNEILKNNIRKERIFGRKVVVMYSGILGEMYDFRTLLEAADLLKDHKDLLFVIRGKGEEEPDIKKTIKEKKLTNVIVMDYVRETSDLVQILSMA
ncbi:MAG: glycosyltransferase family 4 protein, partial [Nitrososphaeria archaeon]